VAKGAACVLGVRVEIVIGAQAAKRMESRQRTERGRIQIKLL